MKVGRLVFLVMVFFGFAFSSDNDFLNIPCAEYKKGATWKTHTKSKSIRTDTTSVVKSINKKQILLINTVKSSMSGINTSNSITSILRKEGDTVYSDGQEINMQGMTMKTTNVPPVPICGKVPKTFSHIASTKNPYNTTEIKYTVSIKKLGKKKIKVPAGEFETIVYQKKTKLDMLAIPNAAQTEMVSIEYLADKVGSVKVDMMTTTIMPKTVSVSKAFPKEMKTNAVTELMLYK